MMRAHSAKMVFSNPQQQEKVKLKMRVLPVTEVRGLVAAFVTHQEKSLPSGVWSFIIIGATPSLRCKECKDRQEAHHHVR